MKKHVLLSLCFLFLHAGAYAKGEIEEVKVTARAIKIVLESIHRHHKRNPFTGNWHYVEQPLDLKEENTKKEKEGR